MSDQDFYIISRNQDQQVIGPNSWLSPKPMLRGFFVTLRTSRSLLSTARYVTSVTPCARKGADSRLRATLGRPARNSSGDPRLGPRPGKCLESLAGVPKSTKVHGPHVRRNPDKLV